MKLNIHVMKNILEKHGPSILTGLAGFGVVLTGYLVHRAEMKNVGDIAEAVLFTDDSDIPLTDTIRRIERQNWKRYIPAGISGLCTIGCMVGANHWHLSKESALAAAALMYKTSGEELEAALKEKFGEDAVQEVKKELAEKKTDEKRPPWQDKSPEKMMIWEPYTQQWFYASQKDILWDELMANKMLAQNFTVTLADILKLYGLKPTKESKKMGWSYDDESFCELASYYGAGAWIDMCPQTVTRPDGTEYFQMEYGIHPNDISEVLT